MAGGVVKARVEWTIQDFIDFVESSSEASLASVEWHASHFPHLDTASIRWKKYWNGSPKLRADPDGLTIAELWQESYRKAGEETHGAR